MKQRALIIGASSERGKQLAHDLLADGWEVVGISRTAPYPAPGNWPDYRWHCLDLSDDRFIGGLRNAVSSRPIDVVVHYAPEQYFKAVEATVGDLAACVVVAGQSETLTYDDIVPLLRGVSCRR